MLKTVYIAGPISKGDLCENINQATRAFVELARAGLAPFCPHWSVYSKQCYRPVEDNSDLDGYFDEEEIICKATVGGSDQITRSDWLNIDFSWLVKADAVLRLPGDSDGADLECALAKAKNIPVFDSVEEVIKYCKSSTARGVMSGYSMS